MGPSEGLRDPRGRACTGAWRAAVVLLLLLLRSTTAQTPVLEGPCGNGTAPQNLRQPGYLANVVADPGAGFMLLLVQSFLDTVQPWPFPHGRGTRAGRPCRDMTFQRVVSVGVSVC